MIIALLAYLPPLILGWLCVRMLMGHLAFPSRWMRWVTEIALGFGVGAGVSSVVFFLLLWMGGASGASVIGVEVVLAGVLGVAAWRRGGFGIEADAAGSSRFDWIWLLRAAAVVSGLMLVLGFAESISTNPNGEWDAFSIWNLRAKFLAGGAESWRLAASAELSSRMFGASHPGYPLLLSAFVARTWMITGAYSQDVPAFVSIAFTLATGLAIFGLLGWLRSEASGLLALVIVFGAEGFVSQSASQYADIPLSFYVLASIGVLAAASERGWDRGLMILAGMFAGFAAWTKNEGTPFVVLIVLASIWMARGATLYLAAGALPGVLVTMAFKMFVAQGREQMFPATMGEAIAKIIDPGRWMQIIASFARNLWQFGMPWAHPVLLLAILAYFVGVMPKQVVRARLWLLVPVAGLLAADFGVYLVTTADLSWHLGTSNNRLYAQIWPAVAFWCLLVMRAPVSMRSPLKKH